jgi:hypothetical protein
MLIPRLQLPIRPNADQTEFQTPKAGQDWIERILWPTACATCAMGLTVTPFYGMA